MWGRIRTCSRSFLIALSPIYSFRLIPIVFNRYLGPLPVIASISLGTERAFRLRASAILPDGTLPRTLSISLPHNSLLIMHGGCQERCKHSVPPMGAIDLFRLSTNYQFEDVGQRKENERGWKERINVGNFSSLMIIYTLIVRLTTTMDL